jgi:hypothetical protein
MLATLVLDRPCERKAAGVALQLMSAVEAEILVSLHPQPRMHT